MKNCLHFRLYLASVLLLIFGNAVYAQIPFFRDQQFQRSNSDGRITSLGQDSKGHLWIGTSAGLYRYDGFNYKIIGNASDSVVVSVKSLCVFGNDQLILGTDDGKLYKAGPDLVTPIHVSGYDTGYSVTDIVQAYGNEYWISTYGNGIYRVKDSVATRFSTDNGMPDDFIYSLTRDRKGRIWAATDNGIACIFKLGTEFRIESYGSRNGLTDNIVKIVETGPGGEIWAGTLEKGIAVLDEKTKRFTVPEKIGKWNYGHINCMVLLENEFWVGTDMTGILDYEFASTGRVRSFDQNVLYNRKSVDCMFVDHSGNVWVASGNTLLFTPGERIEFLNTACGNSIGNVRAILAEKNGTIWASTNRGVLRFYSDSAGATVCDMPLAKTGHSGFNVVSFHQDQFGRIWMGTFDKGVLVYHPATGNVTSLNEKNGLVNGNVLSMTGRGATVWMGTLGGVAGCLFPSDSAAERTPKFFSLPGRGPGTNFIYKVFEDSRNRLLTGTDGDGFGIFDGTLYSSYGKEHGLKDGVVYSITEDLKGGIWVATSESGLYRFYDKSIRHFGLSSGITDLAVTSLTTDDYGNIIVVNKNAIDVIDAVTEHVITLGEHVGVKGIDPELNCVSTDTWGNTWIGTRDGIIKLRLDRKVSSMIPTLHLDKVLCFLQPVDTSSERVFNFSRNHISFEYSGIWYDDPEAVTFRYLLEGYSTNWIETRDRFVTFPNLPPGKYVFKVMSSLNRNFKDSREITYEFRIESPFWQKSWFIGLVILFTVSLLALYIRYRDQRTRNLESLNRERITSQFEVLKNQVNPHFLFNSFNTLISIIDEDKDKAVDFVNRLSDFFRRILTLRDKDIISLAEELSLLDDYLFLQKQRYGDGFEVDNPVTAEDKPEKLSVPTLALQMLVENAFKHNAVSARKPLRIEIFVNVSGNIVVRNNKISRMAKEPSTGTGLQNLANRYRLLTGHEPVIHDNFDSFTVILPVIKS